MPVVVIPIIIVGIALTAFIVLLLKFFLFPKKIDEIHKLLKQDKTAQVIKAAKALISRDQRNVDAHFLLGKAYLAEERHEIALSELKIINQLGKFGTYCREVEFRRIIAELFDRYDQVDEALKEYLLLARKEPGEADHFFHIAELFEKRGNRDKAFAYFKKTLKIAPEHSSAHYHLGLLFIRVKKPAEAREEMAAAIKSNPENHEAQFYLGKIFKDLGDFVTALHYFEKSQKSPSIKVKSLIERGGCYMNMQNYDRALFELTRAIKLSEDDSKPEVLYGRYFLALSFEKTGRLDKAVDQWEKIYAKKPSFRDVAEKLSQYQELHMDDTVKDYLTANEESFYKICRGIVEVMSLKVENVSPIPNGCEIVASEAESKWSNVRQRPKLFWFLRLSELIDETGIRKLLENMKKMNITRGGFVKRSGFKQSAVEFAKSRPIDLYGKNELRNNLSKIDWTCVL